ncbi:MAG: 16S rRNA (cytosine(1402)-N(4))-methyltransferase RsmH [Planctomycetota bacterium]
MSDADRPDAAAKPHQFHHLPVLLDEVLALLNPQPGQRFLDCTLGLGGHAAAVADRIGSNGRLTGVDRDPVALARALELMKARAQPPALKLLHGSFADLPKLAGCPPPAFDLILADFGVSSLQFDDPARGFSFRHDAPLDMRMDSTAPIPTAAELLAELPEADLAQIFFEFGEERKSRPLAAAIARERTRRPIATTGALADLCSRVLHRGRPGGGGRGGGRGGGGERIHPATRVFQALRIAVNGELTAIDRLLDAIPDLLAPGGRAAFLSFHSLEDRKVKERFKIWRQAGRCTVETPKPIQAAPSETVRNPRSRSAKLRGLSGWTNGAFADPPISPPHRR